GVATANQATFSLAAGQNRTDVDFGYRYTGSVGDRVWLDANGNGVQDAGETGLNGVTVQLLDSSNNVVGTATTSGDGNYTFNNLAPGTYTVKVSNLPAGTTETFDLDGVASANQATFTLAAGQNRTDVDFGYRNSGSVGDRVWLDANGNGVQDAGEAGINGVTVQLLNSSATVIATATTSGDGNYTFNNLAAGTYTVKVSGLPAGTAETFDLDGVATANMATFSLTAGQNRTDVDFGYRNTGSVGDRVWLDTNANGAQDAGEAGINGVTVQLLDASANVVATTTTSGDGNYTFSNLAAGAYTVKIVAASLPAGVAATYDLDGIATANMATFTLTAGQNRTDVDFGYRNTGSVGDRVWLDANGNGTQDAGEAGINGVTVQLLNSGNTVVATTTTSGDGNYTFNNLAAGTYTVKVSGLPAGTAETYDLDGVATANQATFALTAGQSRTDVDFGYRNTGSIGDRVWNDANGNGTQDAGEPGYNGVTVQLLDGANNVIGMATTSGDGNYTFANLGAGTYTVKIVTATLPAGVAETYDLDGVATANQATVALAAAQNRTDVDFGYRTPPPAGTDCSLPAISDPALNNGPNGHAFYLPGISTDFVFVPNPGSLVTAADGTAHLTGMLRSISNPSNGFTVDVSFTGYTTVAGAGSPKEELFASAYVQNGGSIDPSTWFYYSAFTGTLTGTGNYAGAVISIANTGPAFQVGVGANGKNGNLGASGWFLWNVTSQPASGNLQTTGQGDINVDLPTCSTIGSIGDRVWLDANGNGTQDAGETGINGVTVQLVDSTGTVRFSTVTSGDGNYTFSDVAGNYTVRVVSSTLPAGVVPSYDLDGIATANSASFALAAGQNRTDVDFGYKNSGSVGDRVWLDANGNGTQDSGEAGINGVTVQLLDATGNIVATATTSGDGNYTFGNLAAGTYTVKIVAASLPAGVSASYDLDGIATANQATFALAAGQNRTDVDFGYKNTGSVGDRVWLDANGNGTQDAGEVGINGVTVQLVNSGGTVIATATTSGDGNYTFNNLAAGTYTVKVSGLPAGTAETFDLDGIATANQATFALTAGQNRTDVDFGYKNTGSVGDRVWLDANGNGTQDAGEVGINGVTVQLLNSGGTVIATTTTSGDGNYTFSNLAAGTYTVKVSGLPAGTAETFDLDGVATANQAAVTLTAGQSRTDVDFGYKNTGSVGDRVWLDANGNGTQDSGEVGINGVTVQLLNSGGTVIATTTTSGDGNYTFSNLAAGTYSVKVSGLPAGTAETFDLDGIATANQATFALTAGQNRTDVDFGYKNTGSIGDRVWTDTNGNGTQDSGEAGINGVTVQLVNSGGTVIATTTTSGDGNYTFSNLAAGTYTVKIVTSTLPTGAMQTYDLDGLGTANQATATLTAGQARTDVDFGYRTLGSIGDRVWLDSNGNGVQDAGEIGFDGLTVELINSSGTVIATTVTSGDGNYTFANLPAGTYSVRLDTVTGMMATYDLDGVATPNFATFTLAGGQNRTDVDFGVRVNGCAEGAPLDPTYGPTTGGQAFWFPGIVTDLVFTPDPGTFLVNGDGTASLTGTLRSVSDPTKVFTVSVNFSGLTGTAPSGSPKKELQSSAYSENGGPINTASWLYFTSYTGTLTGSGSYAGAVITISRTGPAFQIGVGADGKNIGFGGSGWFLWTVTHQPTSGNSLQSTGQGDIDIDLDDCNTLGSIGNRVWTDTNGNGTQDSGETGINGVTVQLLNAGGTAFASAITAGDGNYTFNGVPAGTYMVNIVTSTLPTGVSETYDLDGVSSANKATFTLGANQDRTDVDFGYRTSLSIGDRVWNDVDGDGTQDSSEAGISGVTVQLLNSGGTVIATTTTNSSGNYTFSGLAAGTYKVKIVTTSLPASSIQTYDLDGLSTANVATVVLTTASRTDVDFGYRTNCTLSIGDRVWDDADGDGHQDSSESGINGVTVQLLNSAGTVIATTTTSGNGNYTFSSLNAATYTVKIVTGTLPSGATETYDVDGTSTASKATVNLTASRTDVDFGYTHCAAHR
ncbi:MAG TPA: SdrD B-like domain-containing protein, partial [Thermoanaerobaculia bacterium]|nr:SdrD B-like domain-containing protein [Thermoanaerobaculia bacterium]